MPGSDGVLMPGSDGVLRPVADGVLMPVTTVIVTVVVVVLTAHRTSVPLDGDRKYRHGMSSRPASILAVVPVRGGVLPAGGAEAVAEADGRGVLVGDGVAVAAASLTGVASVLDVWEAGPYAPGTWAEALAPLLATHDLILLPASPDGRDLAPRLAAELGRPVLANAIEVRADRIITAVSGGREMARHQRGDQAVVATLQPNVRGVEPVTDAAPAEVRSISPEVGERPEPSVVEVLPPDVATMDLAESPRIVGGGAGLDGPDRFDDLTRIATVLGASMGATRVITDRGWVGHERQIGTTGVVVDPDLYLAFGISGAVQHTAGLGNPEHIISVNTDPHCPMMAMADLAVVCDANAVLDELESRLG